MQRLKHWLRFNWMYMGRPPWETGISPPELLEFLATHPPGRAIDLGCGTGTNLLTMAKAGWQVTGVDFAVRAVGQARRKLARAGVKGAVRAGYVSRLETVRPEKGEPGYDLVLDIGCYHGLPEESRSAYRANLPLILASNGYTLMYVNWKMDSEGRMGITQADLDGLSTVLVLENRQDSQDRWGRRASWLLYRTGPLMGVN